MLVATTIGPLTPSVNQNHLHPLLGFFIRSLMSGFSTAEPAGVPRYYRFFVGARGCPPTAKRPRTNGLHHHCHNLRRWYSPPTHGRCGGARGGHIPLRGLWTAGRDRRALVGSTTVGALFAAVGVATLADILPEPFALSIKLAERGAGWEATIEAASQRPLIGWGSGNAAAAVERVSSVDVELTGSSYF